jgi:hypothetical protein
MVGMREIGLACVGEVAKLLPRVRREQLLEHLGVPELDMAPWDMRDLGDAAAAAFALPVLARRDAATRRARMAAIVVADALGVGADVAADLGVDARSIRRLRVRAHTPGEPPTQAEVAAVMLQMRLRGALRAKADETAANDSFLRNMSAPRSAFSAVAPLSP